MKIIGRWHLNLKRPGTFLFTVGSFSLYHIKNTYEFNLVVIIQFVQTLCIEIKSLNSPLDRPEFVKCVSTMCLSWELIFQVLN